MKFLTLQRTETSDFGTIGKLTGEGLALATIECPWRNNAPELSCIPAGEYTIKIFNSPTFGRVYQIMDVQGRTYILFHRGNWAGDRTKGLMCDSKGCVLLGLASGNVFHKPSGRTQLGVLSSGAAFGKFMAAMCGEDGRLQVIDMPVRGNAVDMV